MLSKYILSAMKKARYEILKDDNTFYGEIPRFEGVYANSGTLEKCREELEEVLEEWLFLESPEIFLLFYSFRCHY